MSEQITTKPRPAELLRQIGKSGAEMYHKAYEEGLTLSAWLETQDPSEEYPNSRLDAFQRLLKEAGIRTRSLMQQGVYASTWKDFAKGPARNLVPEWWAREWRKVSMQRPFHGARGVTFQYDDATPGSWARPYVDDPELHWDLQLAPAIPLAEMVALTAPIDRPDFRAHYLTSVAAQEREVRVEEGSEVPLMKLSSGDRTLTAKKYGRALEATYEQLQFQRLDEIAFIIQRMAIRAESDKVQAALDVIINGDGNSGTAATAVNLSTMDPGATLGTLSLKGWLNWAMQWEDPYMLTAVICQTAMALQVVLLNTGSGNIPLVALPGGMGFTKFSHINQTADNIRLGRLSAAPANKLVGFDRRMCLKHVTVIGADITEVERFTRNQTEVFTMTEMDGFAVLDGNSARTLDISS